ncbi:hypothetical protein LCGC14_2697130 [marine sediment metagenome]|uniref:Uncharacterized protein n=1 Tax=marine sediment metagenome TaxID=412755 RepID=A0A0F8ZGR6_9ZZZZ
MPIKKEFRLLKSGEFLKWRRKLYIKDNWNYSATQISNGEDTEFSGSELVIPVKVKINIIK